VCLEVAQLAQVPGGCPDAFLVSAVRGLDLDFRAEEQRARTVEDGARFVGVAVHQAVGRLVAALTARARLRPACIGVVTAVAALVSVAVPAVAAVAPVVAVLARRADARPVDGRDGLDPSDGRFALLADL